MKLLKPKKKQPRGRVAILSGPEGAQVAYANADGQVVFCRTFSTPIQDSDTINKLAEQYHWQGMPCTVVLHPSQYQLLLTETPMVPTEELTEAVRWKIKDLVSCPITEATIATFNVPSDAFHGRKSALYVAAIPTVQLKAVIEPAQNSTLCVDRVEISELALHQALVRSLDVSDSAAVMAFFRNDGLINLVAQQRLYFNRRLGFEITPLLQGKESTLESLILEIQRSLDYFESQMGKGVIQHIYYVPAIPEFEITENYLKERANLVISPAPLPVNVSMELDPFDTARCYVVIGGALGPMAEEPNDSASMFHTAQGIR